MKEKYTGRTIDELRKAPVSSYSGEELQHFNTHINNVSSTPGFFSKLARNTVLVTKAAGRGAMETIASGANKISEAAQRQADLDKVQGIKDKLYKKAMLDTAKAVGDITEEEYQDELDALNEEL